MEILFAFAAGVSLPVLTGVWAMLWSGAYKALASLVSLVVVRHQSATSFTRSIMQQHLQVAWDGGGMGWFDSTWGTVSNKRRLVFTQHDGSSPWRIYRYGWAPILHLEHKEDNGIFYYFRWTVDWNKMMREVEDLHAAWVDSQDFRRFKIVRLFGDAGELKNEQKETKEKQFFESPNSAMFWGPEVFALDLLGSKVKDLSLTPALEAVVDEISFWHDHRAWYQERQVAWRRGYLLHGRPGTGKTSFVRALADRLDMPVFLFDLASMTNKNFIDAWKASKEGRSRIVVLEDFDAVFNGREKVDPCGRLGFDVVLNAIDGIERQDGLLLFVTTNFPEAIDPALGVPGPDGLSTRPGRIDRAVEFGPLDREGRLKMARRVVSDEAVAVALADEDHQDSAAQFQERCCQKALQILWAGRAAVVHRRGGCMGTYGDDAQVTCDVCLRYLELVRECKGAA